MKSMLITNDKIKKYQALIIKTHKRSNFETDDEYDKANAERIKLSYEIHDDAIDLIEKNKGDIVIVDKVIDTLYLKDEIKRLDILYNSMRSRYVEIWTDMENNVTQKKALRKELYENKELSKEEKRDMNKQYDTLLIEYKTLKEESKNNVINKKAHRKLADEIYNFLKKSKKEELTEIDIKRIKELLK